MLKQGQTINIGGRWGTVSYLIGEREALVTLDDNLQVKALLEELTVPAAIREASGLKSWKELPEDLAEEARARCAAGGTQGQVCNWLAAVGYDVHFHHLVQILGSLDRNGAAA